VLPPYVVERVLWTVGELRKDVARLSAKLTQTERAEDDARRRIEDLRLKADRAVRDLERAREGYWSETARLQAQVDLLRPGGELLTRAAAAIERLERRAEEVTP
jgi:chromosome segregation ATPase